MARILSIDYGRKRTGIAVTDTLQLIANGLCTVATHDVLAFLRDYVQREPVERIRTMLDGGLKRKDRQNKALVDEISATIILQSYMESKTYKDKL